MSDLQPGKHSTEQPVLVLISAEAEWAKVKALFPQAQIQTSPLGEWFESACRDGAWNPPGAGQVVIFFHGGWGKIAAAATTQYGIDRWQPALVVNLGTAGGFEGQVERGTILLVEKTVVYDILEQMGDYEAHIAHYTTDIDLSWLGDDLPLPVKRTLLVSGDRDLVAEEIPELRRRYGAVAGDWESGAIAFVAARNGARLLILRGITDLVGGQGGEAYGNLDLFVRSAGWVLERLVQTLPRWIALGM